MPRTRPPGLASLDHPPLSNDEIEDGGTGYLIELALDEARSRQFRPISERG
jgi:hypothetical protein